MADDDVAHRLCGVSTEVRWCQVGRLFRVRKTITQMLMDRGYLVSSEEENRTLTQFKEQYGLNPTYWPRQAAQRPHHVAAGATR